MAGASDKTFMTRALELAAQARGKTSPNPMVGAVLVKQGRIIGEGFHRRAGAPHAEIMALKQAGDAARNATLYVTLEPCCHVGRTGPCAEAVIEAGIRRVFFCTTDPDPRVAGKGARMLRKANLEVYTGLLRAEARQLNEAYFLSKESGRPFVTLKTAQTLDGRIATRIGDSQWITGPLARKSVHRLRSEVDAVLVGAGTVRADNPELTVRLVKGTDPYRLVLSSSLNIDPNCKLIRDNKDGKTILVSTSRAIKKFQRTNGNRNLTYWSVKGRKGALDLADVLSAAGRFGFQSILVEAGATLSTAFLKAGLVDKYVCMIAPKMIGEGICAVGDLNIDRLSGAVSLDRCTMEPCGRDIIVTGYPGKE